MSNIDPRVMSHKLSVCKEARPVDQKKDGRQKEDSRCNKGTKTAKGRIHQGNPIHHMVSQCGIGKKG